MGKSKAFTLVELLVVISIIALLMAILMPSLARVRNQAKAVACMSNLKQWSIAFLAYCGDNNGYLMTGKGPKKSGPRRGRWRSNLEPYVSRDYEGIWCCPMAIKPKYEYQINERRSTRELTTARHPLAAWGTEDRDGGKSGTLLGKYWWEKYQEDLFGSYGINCWVYNIDVGRYASKSWRSIDVRGAGNIPMFLDARWFRARPQHTDTPGEVSSGGSCTLDNNEMRRFCIDRHGGFINGVLLDFSARKIGLKELWRLKWNRNFDKTNGPVEGAPYPAGWPGWMKHYKEY